MAQQDPTNLTAQQARAAAMLAAGRRMGATAKAIGVHRVTLWEWTKLPDFQQQMNYLAGPLFPKDGILDAVETRGVSPVTRSRDLSALLMETARRAGELSGSMFQFAKTPGAAWVESGLAEAFPSSFEALRSFATDLEGAEIYCRELLEMFRDALDREALGEVDDAGDD